MKNEMIQFPIWINKQVYWLTVDDKTCEWLIKWFGNTPMILRGISNETD